MLALCVLLQAVPLPHVRHCQHQPPASLERHRVLKVRLDGAAALPRVAEMTWSQQQELCWDGTGGWESLLDSSRSRIRGAIMITVGPPAQHGGRHWRRAGEHAGDRVSAWQPWQFRPKIKRLQLDSHYFSK